MRAVYSCHIAVLSTCFSLLAANLTYPTSHPRQQALSFCLSVSIHIPASRAFVTPSNLCSSPRPSAPTMDVLPPELTREILDSFCTHHSKRSDVEGYFPDPGGFAEEENIPTLARIRLVSKSLNEVATPLLYHSITEFSLRGNWHLLARTLVDRSGLADFIRHV